MKPGVWNPVYTMIKLVAKVVANDKLMKEFLLHEIDREERKAHLKAILEKRDKQC